MAWVEITAERYNHRFENGAQKWWPKGRHNLPRAVAAAAIAVGKAEKIEKPQGAPEEDGDAPAAGGEGQ